MIENKNQFFKSGLSGSTLKLIALVTMLIDHVGAVVLARMVIYGIKQKGTLDEGLFEIYNLTRDIGRIAFPIFCFLLVEGFERTRNRGRYALRLGIFALISEIPFDLAIAGEAMHLEHQNVYFTLLIGLLTMMFLKKLKDIDMPGAALAGIRVIIGSGIIVLGAGIAELLNTDYGAIGILCIMVLFLFRYHSKMQVFAGAFAFLWEITAPLAFIPIWWYNGTRGLKLKYIFYLFYPLHLLVLYGICVMLGIQGYSPV